MDEQKIWFMMSGRQQSLQPTTFHRMLRVLLLGQLFVGGGLAVHSRVCRKFKHGFGDGTDVHTIPEINSSSCPPTLSPFSVYYVTSVEDSTVEDSLGR